MGAVKDDEDDLDFEEPDPDEPEPEPDEDDAGGEVEAIPDDLPIDPED
jgi:hypothetical protein